MFRRTLVPTFGFATGAILLVLVPATLHQRTTRTAPPGPRTLAEVQQIAQELGLYARGDRRDTALGHRLIVSERPLTYEAVSLLCLGKPEDPRWLGTVAICANGKAFREFADGSDHMAFWGEMFLFGDPTLIRTLLEARPAVP
jgi:hypothetical protein